MKVLLLGGSGHLGRDFLQAALSARHEMRVASRQARAMPGVEWVRLDLRSQDGLVAAVAGVEAVVFAAGDPRRHREVEIDGLWRLATAALAAGVPHLVFVSIVGVDRIPIPYYRTKLEAEQLLANCGMPHSILRATQFHAFIDGIFATLARLPFVLPLPRGFHVQSVATEDVAARLLRCLADGPRGLLPDYVGPEVLTLRAAAEMWRASRRIRKRLLEFPAPGKAAAALRKAANTNPNGERGSITWGNWLQRVR